MTAKTASPLLDATIRIDALPAEGRELAVAVDGERLKAIAERLEVDSVDRLSANLKVLRVKGGLHVRGQVEASVTQPCVITFVPVVQEINEPVDRVFLSGHEADFEGPAGSEVFVDLEGEDLPDYFQGPEVDFTDLILETLSLAIDPYPRAPGAELLEIGDNGESDASSPFSALKDLKSTRD